MRSLSGLVIASTLFQIAHSLSLPPQQHLPQRKQEQVREHQHHQRDAQPRVVGLPLYRSEVRNPMAHDKNRMRKRSGTVLQVLDNMQTLYFFNATVGTPAQPVRLHLDTGSSDMWLNTPSSELCTHHFHSCSESGTYSANSSITYQYVANYFNISYSDGTGSAGDFATDVLRFSGQTISDFQFGIGYRSTSPENILGVGYPIWESQAKPAALRRNTYPNLPAKLYADGLISSRTFSIWLNDVNAAAGSILFGGIDTQKFEGNLVTVPVEKVGDTYTQFYITLTELVIGYKEVATELALAVLVDTGTSRTYLPASITSEIYRHLDVAYQEEQGAAIVPCSLRDKKVTMSFRFSSPASITVPVSDMVIDLVDSSGTPYTMEDGTQACSFGILPAEDQMSILGDTFLRSAYVLFDMDRNEISLANARYNVTDSHIVEVNTGLGNAVPFATRASNPVKATAGLFPGTPSDAAPQSESDASALVYQAWLRPGFVALLAFGLTTSLLV
ncbi:hypothetical protein E4U42_004657 [Claviceps africana]|uniref:Probable aspartic-type endopeptidase OPSB n=1 Tax=Claviceps africana TaxID=83212 RepID=A0A8K0J4U7_9HYPO|nr:hypothetical protein E4U42_004657 [Claviceps africana]